MNAVKAYWESEFYADAEVPPRRADLVQRARREIAEDRRIASMMRQERNREIMLQRARVTEELIIELGHAYEQGHATGYNEGYGEGLRNSW